MAINKLMQVVKQASSQSARSLQTKVGPSELGGCRREFWYKINEPTKTNENQLVLASYMGTAIHKAIEADFRASDPTGARYMLEVTVETEGIEGHLDCYDLIDFEVIDWKTTKQKNQGYFPNRDQIWQVMVYALMMIRAGHRVDKVTLVSLARDGDERDLIEYSVDYDEAIALEALAWYKNEMERQEIPAAEKDATTWCQHYCAFFGKCEGIISKEKGVDLPLIKDDLVLDAVSDYLVYGARIKELEIRQEAAKGVLSGVIGQTLDGTKVTWSYMEGRQSVDSEAVEIALGYVPKKQGQGYDKISVKEAKK